MTQWMKRHKILTFFAGLFLLGSCGALVDNDTDVNDVPATKRAAADTMDGARSPSPSPTEEATAAEPTPQQVWAANYDARRASYVRTVAVALGLGPSNVDARAGSVRACRLLGKERSLDRRVAMVQTSFALSVAPTYDQALAVLDATTNVVCPEFAASHDAQAAERVRLLRLEERRQERERRREKRAAQAAEERAQQEAQQEYVYYENCTAVENAGAAPIYAGDPGYSGDLDRDGDGVACEQ